MVADEGSRKQQTEAGEDEGEGRRGDGEAEAKRRGCGRGQAHKPRQHTDPFITPAVSNDLVLQSNVGCPTPVVMARRGRKEGRKEGRERRKG